MIADYFVIITNDLDEANVYQVCVFYQSLPKEAAGVISFLYFGRVITIVWLTN